DHPHYLGGQFSYLAMRSLEYGGFDELFKRGETRAMLSSFDAIEEATHWDHYALLASVRHKKRLHSALSKGCSVIDIGCGTGSLIAKLQGEYPESTYVGIDPSDMAVAKARQVLQGKSSEILRMKAEDMDFSARFDLAYLGESLYAAKDKQRVILNCYSALKRGGTIAIVEGILPTSRLSSDENRLIMAMQLDFALQGCEFLSRRQLLLLLRTANFVDILFEPLGGSVYLVTARKR
ncbi:MAG: class I SAM-dependent methyltransferase, partial [Nitrososphaera sp.]|nr:class I SAM-dependent methyltransferase [Nitrososphaera sp.]